MNTVALPTTAAGYRGVPSDGLVHALRGSRAAETASAALFAVYAFVLLVCYYQLRLLREPLLLADGSAELKSYAQAAMAATLLLLVPAYGAAFKRLAPKRLVRFVTVCFVVTLAAFYALGTAGLDIGFAYYVWVGVFGVMMIAQFWAHAAHSFDVASGQRLFPTVMAGATLGGLAGAALANTLLPLLGTWNLMLFAAALLAATIPLVEATDRSVPPACRHRSFAPSANQASLRHGLGLVLRDRYLLALAALVVLLNCVSTTGDYLLTQLVLEDADELVAATPSLDRGELVGAFYGDFYLTVSAVTVLLQLLVVGRVFRWLGVPGAVLALPVIALLGYGLLAFVPIFGLVQLVKIAEGGVNYSVMNTARQALFLPLPAAHQYQGKTAIDGLFWRVGDLVQAGLVFAGLNWLGFGLEQFAALNASIAVVWLGLTVQVARGYRRRAATEPRRPGRRASPFALAALGLAAAGATPTAAAVGSATADAALFATHEPLDLELVFTRAALCRDSEPAECADAPGTLVYRTADGSAVPIDVRLRSRGRWKKSTGNCPLPALFVFFDEGSATGTPFAGQTMLPLTTHCRDRASYEQYLLKEYAAYRIYNTLTDKSLRVRLARIVYRDPATADAGTARFGFFTEHFDSLAARHAAEVSPERMLDVVRVDSQELATLAVFQYMIGNTDWSAVYGHNVVALRGAAETASVVPFDFDFSGLVDADYAGPPPQLKNRSVRERVFRGFCTPAPAWDDIFATFEAQRTAIMEVVAATPSLLPAQRARALDYLGDFFAVLALPDRRNADIVAACRPR